MKTNQAELLQRLEKFSLDSADASFPFSARLARENGWSIEYTRRVITEYKRFAFLALAAGHPVSPSGAVDEAWHLHLLYTENYWKTFCGEILQKPLHHQPTNGGHTEREKFHDWYANTLQSYRKFFGPPPHDIWPTPLEKTTAHTNFVRVDQVRHWIIPKPRFNPALFTTAVLLTLGALVAGCEVTLNPFNLRGPSFLLFFFFLSVVCFAAAGWQRWKLRQPSDLSEEDFSSLDSYSIAYLNGGKILTVNSAITSLVQQQVLMTDAKELRFTVKNEIVSHAHPLESAIYTAARGPQGAKVAELREAAKPVVTTLAEQMKQHGLIVADLLANRAQVTGTLVALIPCFFGGIKILIGISRGKPVGFLILVCIVSLVAALIIFGRRPHRSRRGDTVLDQLRLKYYGHRIPSQIESTADSVALATAIALFGMDALAGSPMADLRRTLQPPSTSGCSGGSSCGSSCGGGGSSCGGGSSGCGGCSGSS